LVSKGSGIGVLNQKSIQSDFMIKSLIYSARLADLYLEMLPSITSSHRAPYKQRLLPRKNQH
jgi:hypothetical protein